MAFYDLSKSERVALVEKITREIRNDLKQNKVENVHYYFSDVDTYIRKSAYLSLGKMYKSESDLRSIIIDTLLKLKSSENPKVRQTVVNAAGEIGTVDFKDVQRFFDEGLFDAHHSVRNAVIGSLKKMGQKNPVPILKWAAPYLEHSDKEIRREICHGLELRGRTHPQDILPLLQKLQNDKTRRVRGTLVHVLGQIAYKKGCLQTVVNALNQWENKALVKEALDEIVDVHERYKDFAILTQEEAIAYIDTQYKG